MRVRIACDDRASVSVWVYQNACYVLWEKKSRNAVDDHQVDFCDVWCAIPYCKVGHIYLFLSV